MTPNAASASAPSVEFVAPQSDLLKAQSDLLKAPSDLLNAERRKILSNLAAADRDLAELRDHGGVAEVDFSEEGGEGSSAISERGHIEALKARMALRVAEIEAALARVESGGYGVCESCGGPIGEARLEAMPDATLCVICKSSPLARSP
jgi:RNA polymerase-binding transcription factor DksA